MQRATSPLGSPRTIPGTNFGRYVVAGYEKIHEPTLKLFIKEKTEEGLKALDTFLREKNAAPINKEVVKQFFDVHKTILSQEIITKFGADVSEDIQLGINMRICGDIKRGLNKPTQINLQ